MGTAAIVTRGLTKRFGRVSALENLDLDVNQGEVLGCLGPNGAGKTTTIRLLLGLLEPTSGSCQVFGVDATRRPVQAHRRVAFVPGEADLWPKLTGTETLHLLGRVQGRVDETYRDELIELSTAPIPSAPSSEASASSICSSGPRPIEPEPSVRSSRSPTQPSHAGPPGHRSRRGDLRARRHP